MLLLSQNEILLLKNYCRKHSAPVQVFGVFERVGSAGGDSLAADLVYPEKVIQPGGAGAFFRRASAPIEPSGKRRRKPRRLRSQGGEFPQYMTAGEAEKFRQNSLYPEFIFGWFQFRLFVFLLG